MAFIRPTRPTGGVPRRGDPARFAYITDYHLWSSGRTALPQVTPPAVTAGSALEVPGVIAPWEFGQHLDVYLLRDAILLSNGRTRRGHAVLMFEDATDVLPQMLNPPPPGLPPAPGAGGIAITVTKTTHTHSSPEHDDSEHDDNSIRVNSIVQAIRPGTPIVTTPPHCPPNSPRTRPVTIEEVEDVEGEYDPFPAAPADAQDALKKLEDLVSAWSKKMDIDGGPTWTIIRESEEVTTGDEDGATIEGTPREDKPTEATTGDTIPSMTGDATPSTTPSATPPATPLTTPEAPSPILSPLDPNTVDMEASPERTIFEAPDVPYDLRPRPVPRKRYL
ncbi:hypothetical protein GY45DRAFT_1376550, partial [Cubamyces sp. BRFM 1775]